jgi:hypothetical protein
LHNYTYKSEHAKMMQSRREWFGAMETPNYVLWWKPAGELPTLEEGKARLRNLTEQGATEHAFHFKQLFPAPDQRIAAAVQPIRVPDIPAAGEPMETEPQTDVKIS